jgi:hypothetical protein
LLSEKIPQSPRPISAAKASSAVFRLLAIFENLSKTRQAARFRIKDVYM